MMKHTLSPTALELIQRVRTAQGKVARAENELGSVSDSYHWNSVCNRVDRAGQELYLAMDALAEYIAKLESQEQQDNSCGMTVVSSHLDQVDWRCD